MISEKQMKILAFPYSNYDALICDGAVRSGKTSIMVWAFVDWAMRTFTDQRFGICGKTVESAVKNIITPFLSMTLAKERYGLRWRRGEHVLEVTRGNRRNFIEVFGGKDESSYMLIQGRTLAGVMLDEVVLMPESFVNQALARCSVDGSRIWFSCNPASPQHWFYTNWIQQAEQHNALYLHFAMTDNPALSEKVLQRYETMYSGVFYERYILGKWVLAEGLIYPMFNDDCIVDDYQEPENATYYISCDYGTLNLFLLGFGAGMARSQQGLLNITTQGEIHRQARRTRSIIRSWKSWLESDMSRQSLLTHQRHRLLRLCGGIIGLLSARRKTM